MRRLASRRHILLGVLGVVALATVAAAFMAVSRSQAVRGHEQSPDFPEFREMAKTTLQMSVNDQGSWNQLLAGETRTPVRTGITVDYRGQQRTYQALVNRRGATSFSFEKPQLAVSFLDGQGNQTEQVVMDMPEGEDWILNGPFLDRTMMRDYIAYQTAYAVMGYAPRQQYTALYLKRSGAPEEYLGLYLWTEKIRKGKYRVNLQNSPPYTAETSFIAVKDGYRSGDTLLPVYGKDLKMYANEWLNVYPKRTLTAEQRDYIGNTLTQFERVLYHDRFALPREGYRQYVDEKSMMDYYILNEFFLNTDAGLKSTYLHKDIRGKLVMGPVWDFNNAMGNVNALLPKTEWRGLYMHERPWFDRMVQDKAFVEEMLLRYRLLRQGVLSTDQLLAQIDKITTAIRDEAKRDAQRYPTATIDAAAQYFLTGMSPSLSLDLKAQSPDMWQFEVEVKQLKRFIELRGNWLDAHFESLLKWTE